MLTALSCNVIASPFLYPAAQVAFGGTNSTALAKNIRVSKMQEEHLKLTTLCSINLMDTGSAHLALGYSSCMSDLERTGRLGCLEHASRFRSECGNSTRCPCIPATRRNFFGIAVRMPSPQCDNVAQTGGALKAIGSMKYPIPLQKVISRHLALHISKVTTSLST